MVRQGRFVPARGGLCFRQAAVGGLCLRQMTYLLRAAGAAIAACVNASTRIRTRNALLEARHDFHFTIEAIEPPQAEGVGFEPTRPEDRTV
jgi:hypothetical protein